VPDKDSQPSQILKVWIGPAAGLILLVAGYFLARRSSGLITAGGFILMLAGAMLVIPLAERIRGRLSRRAALVTGLVLFIGGLGLFWITRNLWLDLVALLMGAAGALILPTLTDFQNKKP
jgi:Na+/melibiose symporter-like transporter